MGVCRNLVVVLGDQLDRQSAVWDDFDPSRDQVWMAEVVAESQVVPSHRVRTVMFLSAMRHFAKWLAAQGYPCDYRRLSDPGNTQALDSELAAAIRRHRPIKVVMVGAGEYRVQQRLEATVRQMAAEREPAAEPLTLELRADRHFLCSPEAFREFAANRKEVRLEYFYRQMRKQWNILMEGGQPVGGQWNFDADNRQGFGKHGPPTKQPPRRFPPDSITQQVMAEVEALLPDLPGSLAQFDWPVSTEEAEVALEDFLDERLPLFGQYQDAMWQQEPYLYHSRLSAALNLKLLSPLHVIQAAVERYQQGRAPLNSVEGFVRQILGWREYVRGVYWWLMPEYLERNELQAKGPLPEFFWTGETPMQCLSQTIRQTLEYGYAHHIQRLMVTGLYCLLLGVDPKAVHRWYLAVYLDAVEWVELPNTLGMSQYGDGGIMASKPYIASGKYIDRMSNYCSGCRYNPAQRVGPQACPFTTLYWDFLARHQDRLAKIPRMRPQLLNLERISPSERQQIRHQADQIRQPPQ